MDLQLYAQAFYDVMQTAQPILDTTIKFGGAVYTIGSSVVKVLQKGKYLSTYAVGKKKTKVQSKTSKVKSRSQTITKQLNEISTKRHVAIVVEVSRPAINDATRYLKDKKIDANLVVVTNIKNYNQPVGGLDENKPQEWFGLVQEFSTAIDLIKREMGAVHMHIFLATPVALAYGLGSVWGTVDEATVYHWNSKEYKRVLEIKRELRFQSRKKEEKK